MAQVGSDDPLFNGGFFFQAEDGIRGLVRSRGLGDVYKRQGHRVEAGEVISEGVGGGHGHGSRLETAVEVQFRTCLLYTSDAADDLLCVDLGGRRII